MPLAWLVLAGVAHADDALPTKALDDAAYRFCHEAGIDKEQASEFCALLAEAPEGVCPGMRASCTTDVEDRSSRGGCNQTSGSSSGERVPAAAPEPPPTRSLIDVDFAWLGEVARWVLALLVGAFVLVLLRVLARWFGWGSAKPAAAPVLVRAELPDDPDDPLPDVPDAPSGTLLERAQAALMAGDTGEAVMLARGAALRALGDRGALRLHRSRTDREYVSQLRADAAAQGDLREVVGAAEHHLWGGRRIATELAQRVLAAAGRLVGPALLLWALLPGAARAQSYERYEPRGDAALLEVFLAHGYEATWRLTPLQHLSDETDALVLDAVGNPPSAEGWDALRAWVEGGGVLLVAGDAATAFPELGELVVLEVRGRTTAEPPLRQGALPAPHFAEGPVTAWALPTGRVWASVDTAPDLAVVQVLDLGDGVVVSISDDRLLENASLVHPDNEVFLGDVLYSGQGRFGWPLPTPARVQLATRSAVASEGGNNPAGAMANARLLPLVLQILVLWLLAGLWRGWPFGALRDPPDEGRLAFSEHLEALGTRYFRLGASRLALVRLGELWLARLGPTGLQLAAQRSGRSPEDAARWVEELEQVVADPEGPDHPTDLDRVEELWRITHTRAR